MSIERRRTVVVALFIAVVAGAVTLLLRSPDQPPGPFRFETPLAADAALAPGGERMVARLAAQAAYTPESTPVAGPYPTGYNSIIKEGDFSVPVWTVPAGHPTQVVTWVDGEGRPHEPGIAAGLQDTFDAVPIPTGVGQLQADGSDGHLVVHQPSSDTLWEFWAFREQPDGAGGTAYVAGYGARVERVSTAPAALPNNWGARGTSLQLLGGVLRMTDFVRGKFPYAIGMSLPVIAEEVVPPATRGDGPSSATPSGDLRDAVPEGARFRLPADYDCGRLPGESSGLLMLLCAAARDYGMIVHDKSGGTVTVYAEDDRTVGTPYQSVAASPWQRVRDSFDGRDAVLAKFPWGDLQQLAPTA